MWTYFFMFLALVAGTFTGMGGTLLLLAANTGDLKRKKKTSQTRNNSQSEPVTFAIPAEPDESDKIEAPLTRKIPPKDFSMTDFNCAEDGIEADSHIASQQQRQDNAYNALKRRQQ